MKLWQYQKSSAIDFLIIGSLFLYRGIVKDNLLSISRGIMRTIYNGNYCRLTVLAMCAFAIPFNLLLSKLKRDILYKYRNEIINKKNIGWNEMYEFHKAIFNFDRDFFTFL